MRCVPICSTLALGLAPFAVSMLDQAHAEFCACKGLVVVAAAVLDGSDFTTANWTKAACAGTTAHEIICNNDLGTPALHYVTQSAATVGIQPNHIYRAVVDLKAGTTLTYALLGNAAYVAVNLTTGAAAVVSGTATVESCVASPDANYAWRLTYTMVGASAPIILFPSTGMAVANATFAATGTESIKGAFLSVTQVNISQADDTLGRFSAAAVASPNDLSQAIWVKSPAGMGSTATTITDTVDGAPTTHFVRQVTVSGLNLGRQVGWVISVPGGGSRYQMIAFDGANATCYLDTQGAGAITFQSGLVAGATYSGGILRCSNIPATSADVRLYTCDAVNHITYQGSGAVSAAMTVLSCTQPIAIYQTTAANRPALEQDSAGRFYMRGDSVNDRLAGFFAGSPKPITVLATAFFDAPYSAPGYLWDSGTSDHAGFYRNGATDMRLYAGAGLVCTVPNTTTIAHAWSGYYDSAASSVGREDGQQVGAGNAGTATNDGFTALNAGSGAAPSGAGAYEYAIIDGALADCYHARYANMAAKRWGAAHA